MGKIFLAFVVFITCFICTGKINAQCTPEVCNGIDDDCDSYIDASVGNALHFAGVNDYMTVGTWWNYQTFTIELWINPSASQVEYADIIDNHHYGGVRWVCQKDGPNWG